MADIMDDSIIEQTEEDITNWILDNLDELRTDEGFCLKVSADLPPISRVEHDTLLKCVDGILRHYNIEIPPDIQRELKEKVQHEAVFLAPSVQNGLRPRTVSINTHAEVRALFIRGEPPIHGRDGKIEVHFDYSEKPGKMLPDGTIDFRNINRFPQAKEGQVLLTIYEPTQGIPGTDVEGNGVPPKIGKQFEVEAGDGVRTNREYDEEEKRYYIAYVAERPGIVICTFEGDIRDATHLRRIEIKNQITVRDIDFSTGNIGDIVEEVRCVADVTVEGDIKGSFAVIINGNLEVKGAVEGEKIDVSGHLRADFVRSSVTIGKKAEIGSALNAHLFSDELIVIEREVARCVIESPVLIFQPRGTPTVLMGQLDATVSNLYAKGCEIRSKVNIKMGERLLRQLSQIEARRQAIKRELELLSGELKDKAMIFLQKIKVVRSGHLDQRDEELDFLQGLGTRLLKGEAGVLEVKERLEGWGAPRNQANMGIVKAIKSLIQTKEDEERLLSELEAISLQENGINEQLSRMEIVIDGVLKGSGSLSITCGEERLKWQADPVKDETPLNLQVKYVVGQGLVVSEL